MIPIVIVSSIAGWAVGKRVYRWLMFNYGPRKADGGTT
jgi:hypothetical protein